MTTNTTILVKVSLVDIINYVLDVKAAFRTNRGCGYNESKQRLHLGLASVIGKEESEKFFETLASRFKARGIEANDPKNLTHQVNLDFDLFLSEFCEFCERRLFVPASPAA